MNSGDVDSNPASLRQIGAAGAGTFARDVLLFAGRTRPVVAVTTEPHTGRFPIDPAALVREVAAHADVVTLETGDATWALSEALPARLDVFGGAARIWRPGLSRTSDPYDHPLLFTRTADQRALMIRRITAAVRDRDPRAGRYGPWRPSANGNPAEARASKAGTSAGAAAARRAAIPSRDQHRPPPVASRRRPRRGPKMWLRLAEVYQVGDVVRGRICRVEARFALVEILPGTALLAPLSELDWTIVRHPMDLFSVGDRVKAKILSLDPEKLRGTVSIKQAYAAEALPAVSPRPGEPPFLGDGDKPAPHPGATEEEQAGSDLAARVSQLTEELESALADRAELMKRVRELRKDLRGAEDRLLAAAGESDPTASETAFLAAVRVEYARRFNESDRERYPLQRMRVGRAFLGLVRCLHGVSVDKVVEVCAQVACLRAHEIPAREVHELRSGGGGTPARTRASDGAKAWRCSLQDGTPSARRLHWWDIPGKERRTIEFASVAVHDDYSIPS